MRSAGAGVAMDARIGGDGASLDGGEYRAPRSPNSARTASAGAGDPSGDAATGDDIMIIEC